LANRLATQQVGLASSFFDAQFGRTLGPVRHLGLESGIGLVQLGALPKAGDAGLTFGIELGGGEDAGIALQAQGVQAAAHLFDAAFEVVGAHEQAAVQLFQAQHLQGPIAMAQGHPVAAAQRAAMHGDVAALPGPHTLASGAPGGHVGREFVGLRTELVNAALDGLDHSFRRQTRQGDPQVVAGDVEQGSIGQQVTHRHRRAARGQQQVKDEVSGVDVHRRW